MLLVLCVLALFGQAIGQHTCGPSMIRYLGGGEALIQIPSQASSFTITVTMHDRATSSFGAYPFPSSGGRGQVRLVKDDSRTLTFMVQFPSASPTAAIYKIVFNGQVLCRNPVPSQGFTSTTTYSSTRQVSGYNGGVYPSTNIFGGGNGIQGFPSPSIFDDDEENGITSYSPESDVDAETIKDIINRIHSNNGIPPQHYSSSNSWGSSNSKPWTNLIQQERPPATPSPTVITKQEACGSPKIPKGLILGGKDIKKGEWPWLAALLLKEDMRFFCGSTIISNKHLITAAHCMFDPDTKLQLDSKTFIVGVGKHDISDVYDGQFKEIKKVIIHENFDRKTLQNDITILVLEDPLQYSHYILPICLWPVYEPRLDDVIGADALVGGWGRTTANSHAASDTPMYVKVPIVSSEMCLQTQHNAITDNFNPDISLCAGARNGNEGPCEGDSGGPLTMLISNTDGSPARWYLRGIVSFNPPGNENACSLDYYTVFTDVAKYDSWITNAMKQK